MRVLLLLALLAVVAVPARSTATQTATATATDQEAAHPERSEAAPAAERSRGTTPTPTAMDQEAAHPERSEAAPAAERSRGTTPTPTATDQEAAHPERSASATAEVRSRGTTATPTPQLDREAAERGRGARPRRPRGTGAVVYATAARAYLDVGTADGLAPGAVIVARRGGAEAGRCTVDLVGEHHAACASGALRPGDTFTFAAAPEPPVPVPPPALPTPDELAARARAAAEAPVVRVEFRPDAQRAVATGTRRRIVVAGLEHVSWASTRASTLSAERLDLALRGAPLGAGVLLDVEARAERWVPGANPRFRPEDDARLYVWQAQLTAPVSSVQLSAGRILPYRILGATVFDGASASLRRGNAELGLFGGAVPEPDTLSPTGDRATGGGFWAVERAIGGGALRHEGRVAVVRSPELGTRVEAMLAGRAWLRSVDVSAEAQLGAGGDEQAAALVDSARVDVTARPTRALSVGGSYRHAGLDFPDALEPALFPGRGEAADAWGAVELWSFLRVGATGGLSRDAASGLDRTWGGPELGIPRLFGRRGGLVVGYLEEGGWLAGRSAYGQLVARPWSSLRLLGRATWAHEKTLGADRDEVGVLASAAAELGRHLGLRLSALGRMPIRSEGGGSTPWGVTGTVALYAAY